MPSDSNVVGTDDPRERRGSPPSLPPDCLLPFQKVPVDRFGGSTREVPLNPRSLYDEKRNTVSMQTVLYYDETKQGKPITTPNYHQNSNNHTSKPRLSSESEKEIERSEKIKRAKEINPIATLPRHSAAVNAMMTSNDRNLKKESSVSFHKSSALELDVMPS